MIRVPAWSDEGLLSSLRSDCWLLVLTWQMGQGSSRGPFIKELFVKCICEGSAVMTYGPQKTPPKSNTWAIRISTHEFLRGTQKF